MAGAGHGMDLVRRLGLIVDGGRKIDPQVLTVPRPCRDRLGDRRQRATTERIGEAVHEQHRHGPEVAVGDLGLGVDELIEVSEQPDLVGDTLGVEVCASRKTVCSFERVSQNDLLRCLLYTSPSPRDRTRSRMPSSA